MNRLLLAFAIFLIALPAFAQPEPPRRCLSDSPCRDNEFCLKTAKDDWGTCFPRIFGKPACTSDSDCASGFACQRPNTSAQWSCKKKR